LRGRRILIVDDHDPHRRLLVDYLSGIGCECIGAGGGNEALARLEQQTFDLILLDLRMDDLDGMEVLKRAREQGIAPNCIMMSAEGTISHAVEAIRLGAKDFLVKPFELAQLLDTVCRVLGGPSTDDTSRRDPRKLWRDKYAPKFIGDHPALLEVFLVLERIATTDCTVLVLGESGTGKELVARAVHEASNRRDQAFVPVNCGAIPETLIESELFGHARGAFSGATQAREGRFAVADGGTLFLDEIGEMSLSVQVKFLRVLQEQEFVPVGETKPRKCDVRIIAATNKNLEKMAQEKTFREDLFYRLNLIPIHLPPLRDRIEDVPILTAHFMQEVGRRRGRAVAGITDEALALMMQYTWPGNVRELENVVERMTLLHQGSGTLGIDDVPTRLREEVRRAGTSKRSAAAPAFPPPLEPSYIASNYAANGASEATAPVTPPPYLAEAHDTTSSAEENDDDLPPVMPADIPRSGKRIEAHPADLVLPREGIILRDWVHIFETSLIEQALERTEGNRNKAARLLGMNRTTLVEKIRRGQK